MIIKKEDEKVCVIYIDEPLSYEYDSNSETIVLLDGYMYDIIYKKDKYKDTIDLRGDVTYEP